MKIGVILPIGRTDMYGYQYHDLIKLVIKNLEQFFDRVIVISSSRYIKKDLFENREKTELISNEKTWFKLINGKEVFSWKILANMQDIGCNKLKNEGFDASIQIHVNQYVPKSSKRKLRKSIQNMLNKNESYTWLYKSYQCGKLLFSADRRLPWIFNLNNDLNWIYSLDSIVNKKTNETVKMQAGDYRENNDQAIIDVNWECTYEDMREKYEFTFENFGDFFLKYFGHQIDKKIADKTEFMLINQKKINNKRKQKKEIDDIGEKILNLRQKEFISYHLENNYEYNKPSIISNIKHSLYRMKKKF